MAQYSESALGFARIADNSSGYASSNFPVAGRNFETLASYYAFKPPVGSALAFMPPKGNELKYVDLNRTVNVRIPQVRFGYDTLSGNPIKSSSYGYSSINAPGAGDNGGGNYFSLSSAYTPR